MMRIASKRLFVNNLLKSQRRSFAVEMQATNAKGEKINVALSD